MPKYPTTPSKTSSKPTSKSPSKSPSTPKKPRTYTVWRSPVTAPNTSPLATPNGPSIKRTAAVTKYKIKPADLDTILPISRQPNHMGGSALIQVYNESDVAALTQRVRPGKPLPELAPVAGPSSAVVLAKKNGRQSNKPHFLRLLNAFQLTSTQMDQLNPVSTTPNAYGTVTKYYNRCDVENLKLRIEQLKAARSNGADSDFDGLDGDGAAALFAEMMHR
ncbi:hypothetical protein DFH06DRAFT_1183196 [Mycena polygramma]|nr:hypothetical protein DFH06DRAFT_1183196 [Mycena polygramma]